MAVSKEFKAITEEEIQALGTYEIVEHKFLDDIHSESYLLQHKKTGARVALLPNNDSNKVFYVAFRTPPTDSTGVAHIIEHTVLCGSRDFPIKDPFIEVVKGSLNTFLNAMTYPDKTVYPVASTNEKDFDNLMHVYLDAVFHPNIYANENIFRQEGWHYEHEDGEIKVNGVVYNEMKGVMSSPDDVLNDKIMASLYPETTYSIVSGGDPEVIPSLTYENYLDFHKRYYHPSNSYIYLYGDMDMAERLTYLDEAYLGTYERLDIDSSITPQKAFEQPVESTFTYAVQPDEDTEGKTYLSYNASIPVGGNQKENLAFKILDYVLCDAEGAPVKEAVRKKGIGEDCSSLYESGILQPMYSITAKYANPDQKDAFIQTIDDTLRGLVKNGINQKSLLAGINYYEFHYREADFGLYPKGLILGLDALDTWLYDDKKTWQNLEIGPIFAELKEEAKNGYFEKLIQRLLLDNPHKSIVLLEPEQGLTEKMEARQKEAMAAFAANLSEAELKKIDDDMESLRAWQETPDTEEDINKIPVLSREDLGKESQKYVNEERSAGDVPMLTHPLFTSDIDYVNLVFDITKIPARLFPYLGMFKTLLGVLDTEKYSYADFDREINIVTGGISPSVSTYTDTTNVKEYKTTFEVTMKAMHPNFAEALELVKEMILHTKFTDLQRIREVLEEERSGAKSDLPSSGHATAIMRATSYFSATSKILDEINGVGYYRMLDETCNKLGSGDESFGLKLCKRMEELAAWIFTKDHLLFDMTEEREKIDEVLSVIEAFGASLPVKADDTQEVYVPELTKKNEGFTTAGQVQFVCRAGNFLTKGVPYNGSLRVLKVIMGYDYLWRMIRMKGGAYGCMSGYSKDGDAYFVTYRDPHLQMSIDTFEGAADYIKNFEADDRTMTKYVIGAISALDKPLSPNLYGRYSLTGYLTKNTDEAKQKEREQVLNTSVSDIRSLSAVIDGFMQDNNLVVVGSAQKIEEYKDLFDHVEPLV